MRIQRDLQGRFHDEQGRFVKLELSEEELESLLHDVNLRKVGEHTYERANHEFEFKEKRKPDEIFFNLAFGTLGFFMLFAMFDVFGR